MNKNQTNGEYLAPSVKVVETKVLQVLCASGTKESYDKATWNW